MMTINGENIKPGEVKRIDLEVAQLPTRTPINIPVTVARSKQPGPTLLLMAGLHGDEINGIDIIRRILDHDLHIPDVGTVITIPILNIFGFIHFSREVPDGKDVNRSFPGTNSGSLASKVAYTLMTEIIPHIDYGIDLHTGGASRTNYPQIRAVLEDETTKQLADWFQAPITMNAPLIDKSLRWAAAAEGKHIIVYEAGESLRFDQFAIQQGVNGILRVMHQLGMRNNAPNPDESTQFVQKTTWRRATASGLWIHKVQPGDTVDKNQRLGYITGPYGDFKVDIISPQAGIIIGLNNMPVVNKGDALAHLGYS